MKKRFMAVLACLVMVGGSAWGMEKARTRREKTYSWEENNYSQDQAAAGFARDLLEVIPLWAAHPSLPEDQYSPSGWPVFSDENLKKVQRFEYTPNGKSYDETVAIKSIEAAVKAVFGLDNFWSELNGNPLKTYSSLLDAFLEKKLFTTYNDTAPAFVGEIINGAWDRYSNQKPYGENEETPDKSRTILFAHVACNAFNKNKDVSNDYQVPKVAADPDQFSFEVQPLTDGNEVIVDCNILYDITLGEHQSIGKNAQQFAAALDAIFLNTYWQNSENKFFIEALKKESEKGDRANFDPIVREMHYKIWGGELESAVDSDRAPLAQLKLFASTSIEKMNLTKHKKAWAKEELFTKPADDTNKDKPKDKDKPKAPTGKSGSFLSRYLYVGGALTAVIAVGVGAWYYYQSKHADAGEQTEQD